MAEVRELGEELGRFLNDDVAGKVETLLDVAQAGGAQQSAATGHLFARRRLGPIQHHSGGVTGLLDGEVRRQLCVEQSFQDIAPCSTARGWAFSQDVRHQR